LLLAVHLAVEEAIAINCHQGNFWLRITVSPFLVIVMSVLVNTTSHPCWVNGAKPNNECCNPGTTCAFKFMSGHSCTSNVPDELRMLLSGS